MECWGREAVGEGSRRVGKYGRTWPGERVDGMALGWHCRVERVRVLGRMSSRCSRSAKNGEGIGDTYLEQEVNGETLKDKVNHDQFSGGK